MLHWSSYKGEDVLTWFPFWIEVVHDFSAQFVIDCSLFFCRQEFGEGSGKFLKRVQDSDGDNMISMAEYMLMLK